MKKIYVLHEYGAKSHYRALKYLCEKNNIQLKYREFRIFRDLAKSIFRMDKKLFFKQFKNIFFLINLIFSKNKKVVLGIAPYDFRLKFLKFVLRNHKIFYHTSWIKWDKSFYPKKLFVNEKLISFWEDFLKNDVLHIFAVSNYAKNELIKNLKIDNSKITVVYHSFDDEIFKFDRKKRDKTEKFRFLYVGRLTEQKGISEILDYFSFHKENPLTLVGNGVLTEKVKRYAEDFDNINYLGFVSDQRKLAEIYNCHDFLLLNTKKIGQWEELFGIVIVEAMACGVVPIATNHAGPREIITNEKDGFLTDENEFIKKVDEITKKIVYDEYKDIQNNAVEKAKKFTVREISKKWGKILEEA